MNILKDTPQVPGPGHFEFQLLDSMGDPKGHPTRINTDTGLILNSHPNCDPQQIRHLAELARNTPDYPYDLSAWAGPEGARYLQWWARIYWRKK